MSKQPLRELIERDRLVCAAPGDSVRTAARLMAEHVCGSVLVMADERLVGIFTERDLAIRAVAPGLDLDKTPLGDVMTKDPDTVGADAPVEEAVRRMDEFSYRYLPIMDDGKPIGVLSMRCLAFRLGDMQRELDDRHAVTERLW